MPLSAQIISLIRDEIGLDLDFADDSPHTPPALDSLENIYTDDLRGNFNILRTALICYRLRRADYEKHGWDVSTAGTLMSRRQRLVHLNLRIKELENLLDITLRGRNVGVLSAFQQEDAAAEFS